MISFGGRQLGKSDRIKRMTAGAAEAGHRVIVYTADGPHDASIVDGELVLTKRETVKPNSASLLDEFPRNLYRDE